MHIYIYVCVCVYVCVKEDRETFRFFQESFEMKDCLEKLRTLNIEHQKKCIVLWS